MNITFNQVCVSCRTCVGTNEENADSGNSRQPANISKLMTQVGEATDELFCFFFQAKNDKKSKQIILQPLHDNSRMK